MLDDMQEAIAIVKACSPFLRGHEPGTQGAALADMVAIWLVGNRVPGNAAATEKLRERLLALHIEAVRALIPANAALIEKME